MAEPEAVLVLLCDQGQQSLRRVNLCRKVTLEDVLAGGAPGVPY